MAKDEQVRIEIGFDGGPIMSAVVESEEADRLAQALASGTDGALQLAADDGLYTVALRKVAYVKRFTRESRVGFSGA